MGQLHGARRCLQAPEPGRQGPPRGRYQGQGHRVNLERCVLLQSPDGNHNHGRVEQDELRLSHGVQRDHRRPRLQPINI